MKYFALSFLFLCVLSLSATTIEPSLQDETSSTQERVTNTWTGNFSTSWASTLNWDQGHIPTSTEDVSILGGESRYPHVADTRSCNSVTLQSGATLTIDGGTLTTALDIYLYGTLTFTSETGELTINDDLRCFSGGSITFSAGLLSYPDINVYGDLVFNTSSTISLTHGSIKMRGTTQNIYTYSPTTLNALLIYSSSCTHNAASTSILTIGSTFYVYGGYNYLCNANVVTYCKGNITAASGAGLAFTAGTVSMTGSTNSYINVQIANYFSNLNISKTTGYHVIASSDLVLTGDMVIAAGSLWPSYNIYLGGNWFNNVGNDGFDEDYGNSPAVYFNGAGSQYIYTDETFNNIVMDKSAGNLGITSGSEVFCKTYVPEPTSPAYLGVYGAFHVTWSTINAFANGYYVVNGTFDYQQSTSFTTTLLMTCYLQITGTVNIYTNNIAASMLSPGSLVMSSGTLDFHNAELIIADGFDDQIIGGSIRLPNALTIYSNDFFSAGTIELYGAVSCNLLVTPPSRIGSLIISKTYSSTLVNAVSDIEITNDLTINEGAFSTDNHVVSVGLSTRVYGELFVDGGSLKIGSILTVYDGGLFKTVGTSGSNAVITRSSTSGSYTFTVENGGKISALYTIFEFMDAAGINLESGSILDVPNSFHYCTFRNGVNAGKLLTIANDQNLVLYAVNFPTNTWSGAVNVYKPNSGGSLKFYRYTGSFGGSAYEQDSYNTITWYSTSIPAVQDLTISYNTSSLLASMDWSYPIPGATFTIFGSNNPYNNYTVAGSTTGFHVVFTPQQKKFYWVIATLP